MASSQKNALTLAGRIATGLVAGGLTAGVIYVLGVVSVPTVEREVVSTQVDTAAATQSELACSGSFVEIGADPANPIGVVDVGEAALALQSPDGTLKPEALGRSTTTASEAAAPRAMSLSGDAKTSAAAAQAQTVAQERLRGFAASSCGQPLAESWLVAGSTASGLTSLVLLTNPGEVAANVSLQVYSEDGLVETPGSTGIVVEPRSQRIISLNGLAPSSNATIVHMQARGGKVFAALQQSQVQGLNAVGIDTAVAVSAPSNQLVIPGVRVVHPDGVSSIDEHGHDEAVQILRVMSLADSDSTITVTAHGEKGATTQLGTFDMKPELVNEFELEPLPQGTYTITVDSETPLLGAMRVFTIGSKSSDFAWFGASDLFDEQAALAVARGPKPQITLYNPGAKTATVEVTLDANKRSVTVPAGASINLGAEAGKGYSLDSDQLIGASVSYGDDGQLSGYPLQSPAVRAEPLTVYTR